LLPASFDWDDRGPRKACSQKPKPARGAQVPGDFVTTEVFADLARAKTAATYGTSVANTLAAKDFEQSAAVFLKSVVGFCSLLDKF